MLDLMLIRFKGPLTFFFFILKKTLKEAVNTLKNLLTSTSTLGRLIMLSCSTWCCSKVQNHHQCKMFSSRGQELRDSPA